MLKQTGRAVTMASRGVVAAPHYLAAEAGIWAIQQGGNAVDAAIAASTVLSVVYPHLASLGGDAFAMVWDPGRKEPICLNGSGHSGYQATIQFYRDRGHETIPNRGVLAASTVPGAVAAWGDLHGRWGALDWEQLFEPAIDYAEEGFPVPANLAQWLVREAPILARDDGARAIFLHDGQPYRQGEVLVQRNLATTLRALAGEGPELFYTGELADDIVGFLGQHGGVLIDQDLEDHHSDWVDPLSSSYRGHTLYEFPPNTQGLAASLILNLLDGWDVAAMGDNSALYYHVLVEAAKVVLADLDQHLTDPNYEAIPLRALLSSEYAGRQRAQISFEHAKPACAYASGILMPREACAVSPSTGGTAYVAAADGQGLAISLIASLRSDFGSGVVAGKTGVLLASSGASFKLDPHDPNHLEPHKRPFETLMPAMLFTNGRPRMIFGSTGGDVAPQIHAALVTRTIDQGYDVQQAIEAPRGLYGRTRDATTDALFLEGRAPDSVLRQLREMGHDVRVVSEWSDQMGQAQAIVVDQERGVLHGGADPRGDGAAIGW